MINVNQTTKTAYLSDSVPKTLTISFPDLSLTLGTSDVDSESLEITERVMSGDNIEFVGCMASVCHLTLRNVTDDISGKLMIISMIPNVTGAESITLFRGYIDKVEQVPHKTEKKITAYDMLYKLADTNVATWYNNLSFPQTIKTFRDSLFTYLGITQETRTLIFDNLSFEKDYTPQKLCALDVIKSICQINVVFGRMTRSGTFDYLEVHGDSGTVNQAVSYYKDANYQEYTTQEITAVGLEGVGYSEGEDGSTYQIANNFFTPSLDDETLEDMAEAIYNEIYGFSYQPADIDINGLPYIECMDIVSIPVTSVQVPVNTPVLVLERTMKGIQALRDNIVAEGDREIHLFESDLGIDLDRLQRIIEEIEDDLDNLKFKFYLLTNTSDINIGDGETKDIIPEMIFTATKDTVVVFHAEVLVDVSTTVSGINYYDGVGEITYILNSNVISGYTPTETWLDGNHVLHLLKYFKIQHSGINTFEVRMKMSGASVHIKTQGVNGSLYGQNLVASDDWNGFIKIEEHVSDINLIDVTFDTVNDVVSIETESV